jgi:hypothetical protein
LPSSAAALAVGLTWHPARFATFELHGSFWLPDALRVDGYTLHFARMVQVGLVYCPLWDRWGWIRVHACLGPSWGSRWIRGEGFSVDRRASQGFISGHATSGIALPLATPVWLRAGVGLQMPVQRPRFGYLDPRGELRERFRPAVLAGSFELGLEAAF